MPELTVRQKSTRPIVTLKPAVLQAMLAARPESFSLVLARYCQDYKRLTGKAISIDHEQHLVLLQRAGANEAGIWMSKFTGMGNPWFTVESMFKDGFLANKNSTSLLDGLRVAEAFYDLLEQRLQHART